MPDLDSEVQAELEAKVKAAGFSSAEDLAKWFSAAIFAWAEVDDALRSAATTEERQQLVLESRTRHREIAKLLGLPGKQFDKVFPHDGTVHGYGTVLRRIKTIPQPTYQEARNTAMALCDGPRLEGWEAIPGEKALRHLIPGQPLETKFAPSKWWDQQMSSHGVLSGELQKLDHRAVGLLFVALRLVQESPQTTISLDELIRVLHWDPRSTAERQVDRGIIWDWLRILDSLIVIGQRPGTYRDPMTHKTLDLRSEDSLVTITGLRRERGADRSAAPIEVTLAAGPWLDAFRRNKQVLTFFGNIIPILGIPAGRATGALAQTLGFALIQFWREGIDACKPLPVGEDNHTTVKYPPVTRRQLLGMFHCEPRIEDLLNTEHPGRAEAYWETSIKILGEKGLIGFYKELASLPKRRQDQAEAWLDQPLDIRPGRQVRGDAVELKKAMTAARRRRRGRRNS